MWLWLVKVLVAVTHEHAEITIGEYKIPLIGIPKDAAMEECDLCHEIEPLQEVIITECGQILCRKCYGR